jgi:hypothetical protein
MIRQILRPLSVNFPGDAMRPNVMTIRKTMKTTRVIGVVFIVGMF